MGRPLLLTRVGPICPNPSSRDGLPGGQCNGGWASTAAAAGAAGARAARCRGRHKRRVQANRGPAGAAPCCCSPKQRPPAPPHSQHTPTPWLTACGRMKPHIRLKRPNSIPARALASWRLGVTCTHSMPAAPTIMGPRHSIQIEVLKSQQGVQMPKSAQHARCWHRFSPSPAGAARGRALARGLQSTLGGTHKLDTALYSLPLPPSTHQRPQRR